MHSIWLTKVYYFVQDNSKYLIGQVGPIHIMHPISPAFLELQKPKQILSILLFDKHTGERSIKAVSSSYKITLVETIIRPKAKYDHRFKVLSYLLLLTGIILACASLIAINPLLFLPVTCTVLFFFFFPLT